MSAKLYARGQPNKRAAARGTQLEPGRRPRPPTEAFEPLVTWHRLDVRERLGHITYDVGEAFITLDGRPVRLLTRSEDFVDAEARGWYLWSLGDQSDTQLLSHPQLPAALHAKLIACAGRRRRRVSRRRRRRRQRRALAQALDMVCEAHRDGCREGLRGRLARRHRRPGRATSG